MQRKIWMYQDEFNEKFREEHTLQELLEIIIYTNDFIETHYDDLSRMNEDERFNAT